MGDSAVYEAGWLGCQDHSDLGLVQRLHDVEHTRVAQAHEACGIVVGEVEEGFLRPCLRERSLIEHPNRVGYGEHPSCGHVM